MNKARDEIAAYRGLVVICTAAFLVPFMGSALNLALPELSEDLSMKAVTLTWVSTVYLISTAIFQIPFARIADIVGRKKVFIIGILIFSLSTFLSGLVHSSLCLLILRFVSGVGSAMIFGTNMAILASLFPKEIRGKALGINAAVVYAALAVGPFFGGIITHYLGWQSIFFISGAIGCLVLGLSAMLLKGEWTESKGEKFDYLGSLFYGIGIAGVIYGFSTMRQLSGLLCFIIGIFAFIAFVLYEKRLEFPVFNVRLFSGNKTFALSSVAALVNYCATMGISFMLSLYLQYIRDLDANHAGFILISQACIQSVFSLISGHLSDKYSSSKLATLGMSISAVGIFGLVFLNASTPYWIIIALLLLLGVGFGMFSSPNTNVIMASVEKKYYSQASASTGTMRLTGQSFSMGIAGMMIAFFVGNNKITPELYPNFLQSMRMTFIIFAVLCVFGIYASTVRIEKR